MRCLLTTCCEYTIISMVGLGPDKDRQMCLQCMIQWARTQSGIELPLATKLEWNKAHGDMPLSPQQEQEQKACERVGFIFSM